MALLRMQEGGSMREFNIEHLTVHISFNREDI